MVVYLFRSVPGFKDTVRRGSQFARRLSIAAANGFPMKITIRRVERSADFGLVQSLDLFSNLVRIAAISKFYCSFGEEM